MEKIQSFHMLKTTKKKGEKMKRRTNKAIVLKPIRKGKTNYTLNLKRDKSLVKFEGVLNRIMDISRGVKNI